MIRSMTVGGSRSVRALVGLAAVAALSLGVSGCGGDDAGPGTEQMLQGVPVDQAIAKQGGSCVTGGTPGRSDCSLGQLRFSLAPNSWVSKAGERERECRDGAASRSTKVLTNHSWVAYADDDAVLEQVRDKLAAAGAPSEVLGYCDWGDEE